MKTNQKINRTQKHSKPVKSKLIAALLGIGAAHGVAGTIPTQAQPPEAAKTIVPKVDQGVESDEYHAHNFAIAARFVEMSTEDLDAFGIEFKTAPHTILEARTSYEGQGRVVDPQKIVKNEPPAMFSYGTAHEDFKANLDALIAAKKARFISPIDEEGFETRMTDRAPHLKYPYKIPMRPYSVTHSAPITIGPAGLVDSRAISKAKTGSPNLYVTTSVGLDVTPVVNADGTITLTLRSPVQIYLQTGLKETSDTVTIFSRSTQPVEVITDHVRKDPIPNVVMIAPPNATGPAIVTNRVAPPPRLTITPSVMRGSSHYITVTPTEGRVIRDATTTSTQSSETVVTLQNKGTVAMRGIRTRTIKQADQDITMWSYVPTLGQLLNNDEGAEPEKELVCFVTVTYNVATWR